MASEMTVDSTDRIQRFVAQQGLVRGEIISLDSAWALVRDRQALDIEPGARATVLQCLGELTAASLLLASTLKFDGKMVLQIYGDGPIRLLVVECDAAGVFRSTVKVREQPDENPIAAASFTSLVNRSGQGRCVVTLDPRIKSVHLQPYQGIVPLEGDTISSMLEAYMARSEQLETRLWLVANEYRAVGLMLQRMPLDGGALGLQGANAEQSERAWEHMVSLAQTITAQELAQHSSQEVLHRLFWEENLQDAGAHSCTFRCTCSRDKVEAMLRTLGPQELLSMAQEPQASEIKCDFCQQTYVFNAQALEQLATPQEPSSA
jgi:molecular chaperone Hsp33